jgi:hypothetical protein
VSDEAARGDARRTELQLHVSEVSAKLHAELVEARRQIEAELHKLAGGLAAAAKRSEVLERFSSIEEASGGASARLERHTTQLNMLEEGLNEANAAARGRALQADVAKLRADFEQRASLTATAEALSAVTRDAQAREAQWERRQLAIEHSSSATMREVRQMAANLEELGSRLSQHALTAEVEELKDRLGATSNLADKDSLNALGEATRAAASKESVEELRAELATQAAGLQALVEGTKARLEKKADVVASRRTESELRQLTKAVDEKLGAHAAEKLLEHKADAEAVRKLGAAGQRDASEIQQLTQRLEAVEHAHTSARRDAVDAMEHARGSATAVQQLQSSTDKHWQITRSTREEQGQLVAAVRALLLDAELRVNGESQQGGGLSTPRTRDVFNFKEEYGQHGWSSSTARQQNTTTKPLPRVAAAASVGAGDRSSGSQSCCSSPSRRSGAGTLVPVGDVDALARRRRMLAGSSVGPEAGEDSVTLPDALALPGGSGGISSRTPRSTRTRTRIGGHDPYPSLAQAGVLVPIPMNHPC